MAEASTRREASSEPAATWERVASASAAAGSNRDTRRAGASAILNAQRPRYVRGPGGSSTNARRRAAPTWLDLPMLGGGVPTGSARRAQFGKLTIHPCHCGLSADGRQAPTDGWLSLDRFGCATALATAQADQCSVTPAIVVRTVDGVHIACIAAWNRYDATAVPARLRCFTRHEGSSVTGSTHTPTMRPSGSISISISTLSVSMPIPFAQAKTLNLE